MNSKIVVSKRKSRLYRDRFAKCDDSLIKLTVVAQGDAQVVSGAGRIGLN